MKAESLSCVRTMDHFVHVEENPDWVVVYEIPHELPTPKRNKGIPVDPLLVLGDPTASTLKHLAALEKLLSQPQAWPTYSESVQTTASQIAQYLKHQTLTPLEAEAALSLQFALHLHSDVMTQANGCDRMTIALKEIFELPPIQLAVMKQKIIIPNINYEFYTSHLIESEDSDQDDIEVKKPQNLLSDTVIQLTRLLLRDVLTNGDESILSTFLESFLADLLGALLENDDDDDANAERQDEVKDEEKKIDDDGRVIGLKSFQAFTEDYTEALRTLDEGNTRPSPNDPKLIFAVMQATRRRGGSSECCAKVKDGFDLDIVLENAERRVIDGICDKLLKGMRENKNDKVQQALTLSLEGLLGQAIRKLIDALSSPELWLSILLRLPQVITSKDLPDRGTKALYFSEKNIEAIQELGVNVCSLIANVVELARPSGMAGFLAKVGRHIMQSYVAEVGEAVFEELKMNVPDEKIKFALDIVLEVLWEETEPGKFVFVQNLPLFEHIHNDPDSHREMAVQNIVNCLFTKATETVPKGLKWVGSQLKSSLYSTIMCMVSIFVEVFQSPRMMRYVILQYIFYAASL